MGVELAAPDHQREVAGAQLHQRRRRRRQRPLPQEHHGPVAGAGVPARLDAGGHRVQLRRAGRAWPPRPRPFAAVIDPDAVPAPGRHAAQDRRLLPRHRPAAARRRPGEFVRSILESLALRYRQVLEGLEALLGRQINVIHIVGGGSPQHGAQPVGRRRHRPHGGRRPGRGHRHRQRAGAGHGLGRSAGLADARALVRRSFPVETVEPAARRRLGPRLQRSSAPLPPADCEGTHIRVARGDPPGWYK